MRKTRTTLLARTQKMACAALLMLGCATSAPAQMWDNSVDVYTDPTVRQAFMLIESNQYARAYQLLSPLVKQGNAQAQYLLGNMYAFGQHVAQNDSEQMRLWKLSGKNGFVLAQLMLCDGGYLKSEVEQFQYCLLAAQAGNGEAQASLGSRYKEGRGVARNEAEALRWFKQMTVTRDGPIRPTLCRPGEEEFSAGWVAPSGPGSSGYRASNTLYTLCYSTAQKYLAFRYKDKKGALTEFQAPRDGRFQMQITIDDPQVAINQASYYATLIFARGGQKFHFNEFLSADNGASFELCPANSPQFQNCTSLGEYAINSIDALGNYGLLNKNMLFSLPDQMKKLGPQSRYFSKVTYDDGL